MLLEWGNLVATVLVCLLMVSLIIAVVLHIRKKKRFDVAKITMVDIDQMSGHEFEDYLYVLFVALGYEETFLTKKSRDFGADLIFRDCSDSETVVQAKRLSEKVGLDAVQEIYAAKAYYQADKAVIVTSTNQVSDPCRKLAAATQVSIVTRDDLKEVIGYFKRGRLAEAQSIIEVPYAEIAYDAEDSLDDVEYQRGMIKAGDYYYKLTLRQQRSV
ncbi:restriction endonuclease [Halalkalibacter kiskunsagensis]|uniref:Restriction endonuclease n=1 Tax=Halalkalibacter kiskunsagensis TaxID=1548599 RepID=A0ABV6KIL2_9BACI